MSSDPVNTAAEEVTLDSLLFHAGLVIDMERGDCTDKAMSDLNMNPIDYQDSLFDRDGSHDFDFVIDQPDQR